MKKRTIFTVILIFVMSFTCLIGCGQEEVVAESEVQEVVAETTAEVIEVAEAKTENGGVISLKVNPEIHVFYDAGGNVYKLEARNVEAQEILKNYTGYEGKTAREVVTELVTKIGDAGYFVEELEGTSRTITIEVETGSILPSDTFLDEVIADVQECVTNHDWNSPISATNRLDYDVTDYGTTTQTPPSTSTSEPTPEPAPQPQPEPTPQPTPPPAPSVTDYGVTDYGHTDYDDPATDYGHTNYGRSDYDD